MEITIISARWCADAKRETEQMMRSLGIGQPKDNRFNGTAYVNGQYRFVQSGTPAMMRLSIYFKAKQAGTVSILYNNRKDIISVSFNPPQGDARAELPSAMRAYLAKIREIGKRGETSGRPFGTPNNGLHGDRPENRRKNQPGRVA
jgi:hypothetical protein